MVGQHHQLSEHEFEETPEDSGGRGAWCAVVHGVTKTWAQFSDQTTTKNKYTKSCMLGKKYKIPNLKELLFMGWGK